MLRIALWIAAFFTGCVLSTLVFATESVQASKAQARSKNALYLISSSYGRPGLESINRGLLKAWNAQGLSTETLHVYYLGLNNGSSIAKRKELARHILASDGNIEYDYIFLLQQDAIEFFFDELEDKVSPSAPLIVGVGDISEEKLRKTNRKAIVPMKSLAFEETISAALDIFPKTKKVVIVSGESASDKAPVTQFRENSEGLWSGRVEFEYPSGLSFSALKDYLSKLPYNAVVIRSSYGADSSQQPLNKTPVELGIELTNVTRVPTFVLYDSAIGNAPVVGGFVRKLESTGEAMVEHAMKFNDKSPFISEFHLSPVGIFDYAEIQRKFGNVDAVPKNAQKLNTPLGIWEQYREETALTILFFFVLVAIIAIMILLHRKEKIANYRASANQSRYHAITTKTPTVAIHQYDDQMYIVDWNPACERLYKMSRQDVLGYQIEDVRHNDPALKLFMEDSRNVFELNHIVEQQPRTIIDAHGNTVQILTSMFKVPSSRQGHGFDLIVMDVDITKISEQEVSLMRLASVFASASEGIAIVSTDGVVLMVNESFCELTHLDTSAVVGNQFLTTLDTIIADKNYPSMLYNISPETPQWKGELTLKHQQTETHVMMTMNPSCSRDGVNHFVCLLSDISEMKKHQNMLEKMALYDPLTGLANRVQFTRQLHSSMHTVEVSYEKLAVIYIDLDGFKAVNDTYGHDVGDKLLIEISRRMKGVLRTTDTLARLGGDEFAAVLPHLMKDDDLKSVMMNLIHEVAQPVLNDGVQLHVTASIGLVFYSGGEIDPDQLLRQADQAMYTAKQSGKNQFISFDATEQTKENERAAMLSNIARGLANDEFVLYYQPKVNVITNQIVGAEALIRWIDPSKGLIPPNEFLPYLDNHPLAIELGDFVITQALKQTQAWFNDGLHIPVSVNVDGQQLSSNFPEKLASQLQNHPGLPPFTLEIEILESSTLEHIQDMPDIIRRCEAIGVHAAIDDFGVGHATLSYLKSLPVHILKIDQSFIKHIIRPDNQEDLSIVKAIIELSQTFQRKVIAEGVETDEHIRILTGVGCEIMQGYAFSKPLPSAGLIAWGNSNARFRWPASATSMHE